MRAWKFTEFGPIENLRLTETPRPEPGRGEALVRVEVAALNPADRFLIAGKYPGAGPRPLSVGRDACGVVERGAGDFQEGDRVVLLRSDVGVGRDGTLAEWVTVPAECLASLPEGWSAEQGAAGPLVLLTAWQALCDFGNLKPGQTVLVTGASGGVGTASVLLAKALGAEVVATSRSAEKRAELEALGADVTLDSSGDDWAERAKGTLGKRRCDVVVENLGGPHLQGSLELLSKYGRIATIGLLAGLQAEIQVALLIFKRATIHGIHVGDYTPDEAHAAWGKIVEALGSSSRPPVDRVFDFEAVQGAFARLAEGPLGKVLVRVHPSPA